MKVERGGFTMYEVAIIGAGPAGASAAIFTSKAKKQTLLLDSEEGMTQYALVRNHYGVKDIEGPDLVDIGKEQAAGFGAEIVKATVTDVEKVSNGFKLVTNQGEFEARYVIFATGEQIELAKKAGLNTKDATEPEISEVVDVDAEGRTNVKGIWAAGTVAGCSVHTIVTAGDGARVAINVISEINGKRYVDHDAFTD